MRYLIAALPFLFLATAAHAAPVALHDTSLAFETEIAQRYPLGTKFSDVKADLEANGFRCSAFGGGGDAPTQECIQSARAGECSREWAVELRERDGALRAPAKGSVAKLCVGAVLPPKKR